jgi:hypothetical protein
LINQSITLNNPISGQKTQKQLELTFFAFRKHKEHLSKTLRQNKDEQHLNKTLIIE